MLLLLLLLLAGYITTKRKIHIYFRSNTKKSYAEDDCSDVELTVAEERLMQTQPVSLEPKEINKIMEKIFTEQKIQEEVEACVKRAYQ